MSSSHPVDNWADGTAYESYVGRWSRSVASEFITWLNLPRQLRWLDVGCGTGALMQTVLSLADPSAIKGVDPASGFLAVARKQVTDPRADFAEGKAQAIPEPSSIYDAAVSGLVLNFVPEPLDAANEMARVVVPGGTVAAYVWDYAGQMEFIRYFWNAAVAVDPEAVVADEGTRFPICNAEALASCFAKAGLSQIETRAIDIPTVFRDFDDYWSPFLGGQGSAPSYLAKLSAERKEQLRKHLQNTLPFKLDGSISLIARAWAVLGTH